MSLHIVADENIPMVETLFGPEARVTRVAGRGLNRQQLGDAEILLVRSVTRVDRELVEGTSIRFVGTATSGTDHVDRQCLSALGIGFSHAPGSNANSVVEYVLAAIAAIDNYLERLLDGGRVGIVGFGTIGRAVTHRLRALGISCVVNDPWLGPEQLPDNCTLQEALACDVVCLHPELTREQPWPSYHLLAANELALLGADQLLINASRGAVIDSQALSRRLDATNAPQVVLDVWETEPLVPSNLLSRVRLGTAHIAGYSYDGKVLATRMLRDAAQAQLGWSQADLSVPEKGATRILRLQTTLSPAQALRNLIADCYRIEEDDKRLREAVLDVTEAQSRASFDQLRKQYPRRREMAGRIVQLDTADPAWRDLVLALACVPDVVN